MTPISSGVSMLRMKPSSTPEVLDLWPERLGRAPDHQPALGAGALDTHRVGRDQHIAGATRHCGLACAIGLVGRIGSHTARRDIGHGEAVVAPRRGEVGRNLERTLDLARALVVDALGFEQGAGTTAERQRQREQ